MLIGQTWSVAGTVVQSRSPPYDSQRVTVYAVRLSTDNAQWVAQFDQINFHGSSNDAEYFYFPTPVIARYIEFVAVQWENVISMRAAVVACEAQVTR